MQKTNILDFFKSQVVKIPCPACGVSVVKSKLNDHLDALCVSSHVSNRSKAASLKPGLKSKSKPVPSQNSSNGSTSSRLSLKTQRKGKIQKTLDLTKINNSNVNDSEEDVIIIEEIPPSKEISTTLKSTFTSNSSNQSPKDEIFALGSISSGAESSSNIRPGLSRKLSKRSISDLEILESENANSTKNMLPSKRKKISIDKTPSYDSAQHIDGNLKVFEDALLPEQTVRKHPGKEKRNDVKFRKNISSGAVKSIEKSSDVKNILQIDSTTNNEIQSENLILGSDCVNDLVTSNTEQSVSKTPNRESVNSNPINSEMVSPSSEIASILRVANEAMNNDSLFSELSDGNEEDDNQSSQPAKQYEPYYIANFKHILDNVLAEEDNQPLFNDEDRNFISAFKDQKDAAQKLYVRLFQRKYKWLRINKIKYPEITTNPEDILEDLVSAGLVDSGSSKIELETALNLLSLPEMKILAKNFNFNSGKNKSDIKQMVLKHCKEHKSVFFMNGSNSITNKVLKKVKEIIGPCYRISLLPKRLFTRILMLFSLPTISEDDDEAAGGQQQQLITLLQVNKGELVFPEYKKTKETVIFCDRDELIRYEEARQLENDIYNAVETKKFEVAKDLYLNAKKEFEEQCSKSFADRASSMPVFLKRYTSLHVYVRCMTQGVEILQKLREYKEAVALLRQLLKQKVFCQDYSGRWFDRLALNLEQHLKKPEQALDAIKNGLKNKNVRVGYRYSLLARALRITKSLDENDSFKKEVIKDFSVKEPPKVIIKGRLCPRPILGRRHVFISSGVDMEEDAVTVLGVEQLAIEHYQKEGFSEGIHGEGSTFISLYCLLFWDIIYDGSIPDVFISPYQTHPLDLNSEAFYKSRKQQITTHLKTLQDSTVENLKEIVKSIWVNHHGKTSLVHWDRFRDVEHVQGLVSCFGSSILCGICERLAKDFRFTRSGVPDLVVWNPETLKVKVVEVKGPGDKLSSKQILWLDYLLNIGADAELCLVEAVGSKKLKRMDS